ncbi:NRDE family protein [Hyunsoonleella rubra]|uniref:NRDE family protein n=1 Tax=Hyunsoonleella rubra TaxID=1737062 RepID=A0ABW5T830_9FLAO
MCTVTIVPKGKTDFILTSNRDEAPERVSFTPDFYTENGTEMLFPKDELSGGTWIGISEKKRVVCVLNGAFEFHQRKSKYRKSRGIVAKDFMVADYIVDTMGSYDYDDIEPFTIVVADWNQGTEFYELVWDGATKYIKELPFEAHIWSSSTLYNGVMRTERQNWFKDFKSHHILDANSVMTFHKTAGKGNLDYGVIMDRGFVKTTSITQIEKTGGSVEMRYANLIKDIRTSKTFKFPQPVNG